MSKEKQESFPIYSPALRITLLEIVSSRILLHPKRHYAGRRWPYLRWVGSEPLVEELYDLQLDPLQTRNMIHEPAHTAVLSELRARWAAYRHQLP